MLEMTMQVLDVIIRNEGKSPREIFFSLSNEFPNQSYNTLKGYVLELESQGYLSLMYADNDIAIISVNQSAHSALDYAKNHETTSHENATFQFGNIYGPVSMGNHGGTYTMNSTNIFRQAASSSLNDVLSLVDDRADDSDREEIKQLLKQVISAIDNQKPVPESLMERLDTFMQNHSWISAPIATTFLHMITKFF